MDIIINISILIMIIGACCCAMAVWALATKRDRKFNTLYREHEDQIVRVKQKLKKGE
jgi:hypothetical protein